MDVDDDRRFRIKARRDVRLLKRGRLARVVFPIIVGDQERALAVSNFKDRIRESAANAGPP